MAPVGAGGGDGATERLEDVRWWWKGEGGAKEVGVGIGVF